MRNLRLLLIVWGLFSMHLITFSQGTSTFYIGLNSYPEYNETTNGINIGYQHKLGQYEKLNYGLVTDFSYFKFDLVGLIKSSTSLITLKMYSEFIPFDIKKFQPYIRMEAGPSYNTARGEIDFILFGSSKNIHFIGAQVCPGLGFRFEIASNINLQIDLKRTINYSNKFEEDGFFNYNTVIFGVNINL